MRLLRMTSGSYESRWTLSALRKSTVSAAREPEKREYRGEKPVAKLGGRHRSSVVELSIRNRAVVGSNPTGGSLPPTHAAMNEYDAHRLR